MNSRHLLTLLTLIALALMASCTTAEVAAGTAAVGASLPPLLSIIQSLHQGGFISEEQYLSLLNYAQSGVDIGTNVTKLFDIWSQKLGAVRAEALAAKQEAENGISPEAAGAITGGGLVLLNTIRNWTRGRDPKVSNDKVLCELEKAKT